MLSALNSDFIQNCLLTMSFDQQIETCLVRENLTNNTKNVMIINLIRTKIITSIYAWRTEYNDNMYCLLNIYCFLVFPPTNHIETYMSHKPYPKCSSIQIYLNLNNSTNNMLIGDTYLVIWDKRNLLPQTRRDCEKVILQLCSSE